MSDEPFLHAAGITKRFGAVPVLSGVDFELRAGEIVALLGENGAGKSTLVKVLGGVHRRDGGRLRLAGREVDFASPRAAEEAGIAVIHQELRLVDDLDVAANLALGREPARGGLLDRKAAVTSARRVLDRLGVTIDPTAIVGALKVGERQLVEIARALAVRSRLLVMDEPTSALPPAEVQRLLARLRALRQEGVGIVFVSHRLDEVFALADRIVVLREGRVVLAEATAALDVRRVTTAMLGHELATAPRHGPLVVSAGEGPGGDPKGGPGPECHDPAKAAPTRGSGTRRCPVGEGPPFLEARGLGLGSLVRGARDRVVGFDLDLRAGEIVGLAGLLGAGRTEVLELLAGVHGPLRTRSRGLPSDAVLAGSVHPDSGASSLAAPDRGSADPPAATPPTLTRPSRITGMLRVGGIPVRFRSPADARRAGIVLLGEDRAREGLLPDLDVHEHLFLLAARTRGGLLDRRAERRRGEALVRELAIRTPTLAAPITALSGGNQQKVLFGRALETAPRVLLLDEPTRGIDPGAKLEVHELVFAAAGRGVAVLVASSEVPELLALCDRILVLVEGRHVATFARGEADEATLFAAMATASS